jgi:HEAT repeat protein
VRQLAPVLALILAGCAANGAVQAALGSDLASLKRSIRDEQSSGKLDAERAREIAEAVASREIYAEGGRAAASRIRQLRTCSKPLRTALEARAERQDEGGAEAALLLLATGARRAERYAGLYAGAESGAWRAVSARASTAPERFEQRRRYFSDPDERVRRAAFEAALEAPGQLDLEPLVEAARLDPDPYSRSLAVRGVGALGGARAVQALADLWERADEDVRLTIVEAWGKAATYRTGGREALLRTAEARSGLTSVAAAGALLTDPAHAGLAVTLLAQAATDGASDEQLLALATVPLEPRVLPQLQKAAKDADATVRVAALGRLLEVPASKARATDELRTLAKGKGGAAVAARDALAARGDASVTPLLVKALSDGDASGRHAAGRGLLALGSYDKAATLLGDGDAGVRVAIACTILAKTN